MKRYCPLAVLAVLTVTCFGTPCFAEEQTPLDVAAISKPSGEEAATPPAEVKVAPLGSPAKAAPLGSPTKPVVATLGKPGKPKFAMKMTGVGGAGAAAPDRAAEVKRLIDAYHGIAISYYDRMVLAATTKEIAAAKPHEPSARALRPIVRLLAEVVAVDPTDEAALDALLFLNKYVGVPIIDEALAEAVLEDGTQGVDPNFLVLEHHADNPKVADSLKFLPQSPETDKFLLALFKKTYSPNVRAAAGIRLINSHQQKGNIPFAVRLAELMAEDRYLDGVPITPRPTGPTAREWAEGKLREINLVSVGKVIPEVSGEKLGGGMEQISDYRGKVVVLDVWATWCGPCVAMIPHQREMAERFHDQPFALVSVSCDTERETLEEFLEANAMPWNHWWVGADGELKKSLNIGLFPTIIVLDAKGVIRFKNIKNEELEEAVEELIREAKEVGSTS